MSRPWAGWLLLLTPWLVGGFAPPAAAAAEAFAPYQLKLPGDLVTCDLVPVPGGRYRFADPAKGGEAGEVTIAPFWMGKVEVTWDEYDIFAFRMDQTDAEVAANADAASRPSMPYGAPDRGFGHAGYPAISVAGHAAKMFCEWLSKKTGVLYRLPTEAEWEWACREAKADGAAQATEESAWLKSNSDDTTHPVGQKQPNALGLHDLLGNVVEWVVGSDGVLVTRGGCFRDPAEKLTWQARDVYSLDWQQQDPQDPKSRWWLSDGDFVGFRVVRPQAAPSTTGQ